MPSLSKVLTNCKQKIALQLQPIVQASRSTTALAENAFQTMAETQQQHKALLEAADEYQQAFTGALFSCCEGSARQVVDHPDNFWK